mgnify:CR=1 FL=1
MDAERGQVAEYIWSVAILLEVYAKSAGLDQCAKLLAEVSAEAAKFTDEPDNPH